MSAFKLEGPVERGNFRVFRLDLSTRERASEAEGLSALVDALADVEIESPGFDVVAVSPHFTCNGWVIVARRRT